MNINLVERYFDNDPHATISYLQANGLVDLSRSEIRINTVDSTLSLIPQEAGINGLRITYQNGKTFDFVLEEANRINDFIDYYREHTRCTIDVKKEDIEKLQASSTSTFVSPTPNKT